MKNLKYILFMSFIMFFYINAYAETCTYGDANLYFKCTTSGIGIIDGEGDCEIGGKQSGNIKINYYNLKKPSNELIRECDTMYYYLGDNGISGFYASYEDNNIMANYKKNLHKVTKMKDEDQNIVDADLSKFNGKECYWKSNNTATFGGDNSLAYVCKVTNGAINCTLSCAKGSNKCEDSYYIASSKNDFTNQDFLNGTNFLCPSKSLYLNSHYNSFSNQISIEGITTTKTSNVVFTKTNVNPTTTNTGVEEPPVENPNEEDKRYEQDKEYIAAKEQANKYCNPTDAVNYDSAKCKEYQDKMNEIKNKYANISDKEKLNLDDFCQGNVLRVFTTLGWIFFILKILIPLVLIIFGVIDISKAVLSSKDDEIKKSTKTLIMRVVAGIIIFLVPSFLNFIVGLIGSKADGVYNENNGTFADCTSCMLSPGQDYCSVKIGE